VTERHALRLRTKADVLLSFEARIGADAHPLGVSERQAQRIKPHLQEALDEVEQAMILVKAGELSRNGTRELADSQGDPVDPMDSNLSVRTDKSKRSAT